VAQGLFPSAGTRSTLAPLLFPDFPARLESQIVQGDRGMPDELKTRIRAFFSRSFPNHNLQDDDDIFAMGFINSLFVMQLVLFIEQESGSQVENDELEIENFKTIKIIERFIKNKLASHPL
jgi:methoxymalonate biosynthesis acyl carrier protein